MCGRVAIPKSQQIIDQWFDIKSKSGEWTQNINTAPMDYVPVIASNKPNHLDLRNGH